MTDARRLAGVVARLLERQAEWGRGRPLDDDVTFVVVRLRA